MNVQCDRVGGENVRVASRPIGQNCRAVCKRKGGAMRSRTLSEARHQRSALAMVTIPLQLAVFKISSLSLILVVVCETSE